MKILIFVVGWLYLLTFQLVFTVLFNVVHSSQNFMKV